MKNEFAHGRKAALPKHGAEGCSKGKREPNPARRMWAILLIGSMLCPFAHGLQLQWIYDSQRETMVGTNGQVYAVVDNVSAPFAVSDGSTTGMVQILGVQGGLARVNTYTVTNDSNWIGWTTTGSLISSNDYIFLETGEWLESPVLTHGVSDYDVSSIFSEKGLSGWTVKVYTNTTSTTVNVPYTGTDARLRITAHGGAAIPGYTPTYNGVQVPSVIINGYDKPELLNTSAWVGQHKIVSKPTNPKQVARLDTVQEYYTNGTTYADAQVVAYDRRQNKTLRGSVMRTSHDWVFVPSGSVTNRTMKIQAGGVEMMELSADINGATISSFTLATNDTFTVLVSTNNVSGTPTIETCTDLTLGEWEAPTITSNSYPTAVGTNYVFQVTSTNDLAYFRAVQIEDAEVTLKANMNAGGKSISYASSLNFTNGWSISCTSTSLVFVAP